MPAITATPSTSTTSPRALQAGQQAGGQEAAADSDSTSTPTEQESTNTTDNQASSPKASEASPTPPTSSQSPSPAFSTSSNGSEKRPRKKLSLKVPKAGYKVGERMECLWRAGEDCEEYRLCKIIELRRGTEAYQYYVHYEKCDRRLDEWVESSRLVKLTPERLREIEREADPDVRITRNNKRKYQDIYDLEQRELTPEALKLEKEHELSTKVKNIRQIEIGDWLLNTWYWSPYPEAYVKESKLYICEYCLRYMKQQKSYSKHMRQCQWRHPPGSEIYRSDGISVFEVDGKKHKIYCQCLCLLAKLFLDHKTLYYDVEPFLFYIIAEYDEHGYHNVGYFSKEKNSPEDFNLACILVFPQYQRQSYGKFLMALSYELSKREDRLGSPEKPLSDLGQVSYESYWRSEVVNVMYTEGPGVTIESICRETAMTKEDVTSTLQRLGWLQSWKGEKKVAYPNEHIVQAKMKEIAPRSRSVVTCDGIRKPRKIFKPEELDWDCPPPLCSFEPVKKRHRRE